MNTLHWEADNGRSVLFNGGGPFQYHRVNPDQLTADEATVKAPGQDGAATIALSLGRMSFNVSASITVSRRGDRFKSMDDAADELYRAFLPNSWGTLTERRNGVNRKIRCRAAARPMLGNRIQNSRTVSVDFISDAPRWVEAKETVLDLGQEVGGFKFPLRLPTRMGTYRKDADIHNDTGDEIYPIIEIYTTSRLIKITNETTGLFTEIEYPIHEGEKMVIDHADTSAWIYDKADGLWVKAERIEHWLTLESEYWPLVNGKNRITIRNEDPQKTVIARIRFHRPI